VVHAGSSVFKMASGTLLFMSNDLNREKCQSAMYVYPKSENQSINEIVNLILASIKMSNCVVLYKFALLMLVQSKHS
jgi:hypothetical protein